MVDMAVAMEDTALATTARGQLMPTMAAMAMAATALAMVATDMARGLLMLRLTMVVDSSVRPAHMVDMPTLLASAPLMLMPTTAMVDMAAMAATATERGRLMPMPTTATEDMEAMAAMVVTVVTAMESKSYLVNGLTSLLLTFHDTHRNQTKIISP